MGYINVLLSMVVIFGLVIVTTCQKSSPRFLEKKFGNVDGYLYERLTADGILEGTPIGTFIGQLKCVDDDVGDTITYSGDGQTLDITKNGTVTLGRELDRENDPTSNTNILRQIFYCTDQTGLKASVSLVIAIIDVNDNAPVFLSRGSAVSAQIKENAPVNTSLNLELNVTDEDRGLNSQLTITCFEEDKQSQIACEHFRVTARQYGEGKYAVSAFLKKKVDYETKRGYTMTLMAKDRGIEGQGQKNSTVNVLIEVQDTEDSDPEFLNVPLTLYVKENSIIGSSLSTLISARDKDKGSPRPIIIEMLKDTKNLFKIGPTVKGTTSIYQAPIIVNGEIDREKLFSQYMFSVKATELENNVKTNVTIIANVTVNIEDVNDNTPTFSHSVYNISFTERDSNSSQKNTQVSGLNIQITDEDEASNAKYQVVIAEQSFNNTFRVFPADNVVGTVTVNLLITDSTALDYDEPRYRTHVVKIEARQNEISNPTTSTATVTINLIDLNDNKPEFGQEKYAASLREDAETGKKIITIVATDRDEGKNGKILYSLRGTDIDKKMFKVNSTSGSIYLDDKLDYEVQTKYPLIFVATDQGNPKHETLRTLTITVLDINDIGPVFELTSYQTYAFESNTDLQPPVQVKASDPENPKKGIVTYRIVDGNIGAAFKIDRNTGDLTLTRLLDYDETLNRLGIIELIIQATDTDTQQQNTTNQSTNTTVTINLQDENNHAPKFNPITYTATISELETSGSHVETVTATDADYGFNGDIRYTIDRGGLDNFEINNGVITVSPRAAFDYVQYPTYKLVVYAIDKGGPPKTGTTTVTVNIIDANNKAPTIPSAIYTAKVRDDAVIGTPIININATDEDKDSVIKYDLPTSQVQARDSNGDTISAISPFDYRLAFKVDPDTGIVSTNSKLSREEAAEISFIIRAVDINGKKGIQTATTSVIVTILGTALSPITFSQPWRKFRPEYSFSLTERRETSVGIMTLSAYDPACACVLKNYIKVSESSSKTYFTVNSTTGEIRLQRALDYEIKQDRVLRVVVRAQGNNSRFATATVIVQVLDDNDNSPVFVPPGGYEITLGEFERYPKAVGQIFATDKDSGSFGRIEYSISGQGASDFLIYRDTGLIIIAKDVVIDYESRKVYNLQATATDNPQYLISNSEIRKQSSVLLRINIKDENDNAPTFGNNAKKYEFYTVESYNVGTQVGQIVAKDVDDGTNSQITYSIQSATAEGIPDFNVASLFRINIITGVITTIQPLRGTSFRSPFLLYVRARDRGQPSLENSIKVLIHVSSGQLDDGTPYWSQPIIDQVVNVTEHSPIGTDVVTVIARARTRNSSIIYSFLKSTNQDYAVFAIDSSKGIITVNADIDRELQARYTVIVSARESSNETKESFRLININVLDVNDNNPSFSSDNSYRACQNQQLPVPVEIEMVEQSDNGTLVYVVKACDPDAPPNNQAFYYPEEEIEICKEEMIKGNFIVNTNGQIYTNKILDREIQETYLICVRVVAEKSVRRRKRETFDKTKMVDTNRVAYVQVTLKDINDNGPKFSYKPPGLQQVLLSVPKSESVIQVIAIDTDNSPNNRVLYSITNIQYFDKTENFPLPGAFAINPDTGIITVGFPTYTEFEDRYFRLDILASDFYNSNLNDTTAVYVRIFDKVQSMRFVLSETPDKGISSAGKMISELNAASTMNEFKIQQISYHSLPNGNTDVSKTDVCFVIVKEQRVLSVQDGKGEIVIDEKYKDILNKYGVIETGSCYLASSSTDIIDWSDLWWVLVAVAVFIFICCIILIIAVFILHRNYKRYMNTRKTYMVPQ